MHVAAEKIEMKLLTLKQYASDACSGAAVYCMHSH